MTTIHGTDRIAYTGFIQSIELEDGSGSSFNISIDGKKFHVRTID